MNKLRFKLITADYPAFMIGGLAGVHPSRLSEYSRGLKSIPSHHMILLCKYFECEPDDLLGEQDPASIDQFLRDQEYA